MPPPVTIEAEFGGKGVYVDLTTRSVSFSTRRGRDDYTQPYRAGTATVVMRNNDGELDPDNTAGSYYGEILVGRRIKITSNKGSMLYERSVYVGFISDYQLDYDIAGSATVTISCVDGLAELAQREIAPTAVPQETTGARVTAVLALPSVDYLYPTNIDTGLSVCASGTASGNAITYLQQVVTTEQGALFVDANGTLRFLDRNQLLSSPTATFSDDGNDTDYETIQRLIAQTELYNELSANRTGGSPITEDDTTSQAVYGIRALSLGEVLFTSDALVTDMLRYALVRYANTTPRIAEVGTLLDSKGQLAISQLLLLELAASVTVEFTPPGVAQISVPSTIESITHQYTVGSGWRLTFGFAPRDVTAYLVLDDNDLGLLDINALSF